MKIKIIDLFNMIAKGEEVPKKIKYNDFIYIYDDCQQDYLYRNGFNKLYLFLELFEQNTTYALDTEVEIIEDKPKEIEKIEYYDDSINWVIDGVGQLRDLDKLIIDKLSELIDKVNEMSKDD